MKKIQLQNQPTLSVDAANALEAVYTNIFFAGKDLKTIALSSVEDDQEFTDAAWRIAQSIAARGEEVLVIDADLQCSSLTERYGLNLDKNDPGLAHFLTGRSGMEDAIYETSLKGISLMPVGSNVANPTLLFAAPDFKALLDACTEKYGKVLLLAPGEAGVSAACAADGVALLARDKKTFVRKLQKLNDSLKKANCSVLGCVIYDVSQPKKYVNQ